MKKTDREDRKSSPLCFNEYISFIHFRKVVIHANYIKIQKCGYGKLGKVQHLPAND